MYIKRDLEDKISKYLNRKEVLAILGPRQSGKTTLLNKIKNEYFSNQKVKYITFENRKDLKLFENSIDDFRDLISEHDVVFIDEFQYAKKCGQKLKYLYDTTNIKFIISGSASLEIQYKVGKYMVGRMLDFNLWQFSFREYLSSQNRELYALVNKKISQKNFLKFDISTGFKKEINKQLVTELEQFVIYGGYPAVALSKHNDIKQKVLENILDKFLLKDVQSLLKLATDDELLQLSKFLAVQIGNIINYEELANASKFNYVQLKKHLTILQKTFIINLIKPFSTNKKIELTRNPKSFFHDLGLRNSLISDFRQLPDRNDIGAVMENYAFTMLRNMEIIPLLKFWRTKSQAEVDFVIEKNQEKIPVEVKYSSRRIVGKGYYSFLRKYQPSVGIILTKDYLAEEKIENTIVKFIPLSYF